MHTLTNTLLVRVELETEVKRAEEARAKAAEMRAAYQNRLDEAAQLAVALTTERDEVKRNNHTHAHINT